MCTLIQKSWGGVGCADGAALQAPTTGFSMGALCTAQGSKLISVGSLYWLANSDHSHVGGGSYSC